MIALAAGIFIGSKVSSNRNQDLPQKYAEILKLISDEYVDTVSIDSLLEMNIPDLLTYLDPHSVYIPAKDFEEVNDELEGSFSGVGISFQIIRDTVVAVEIVPDGPADKVGLQAGDRLIAADKTPLTGPDLTTELVFKNLRGQKGTTVKLKIARPGVKEQLSYDIVRGDIPVNSVDAKYMIDKQTGYIRVGKFARNTYQEFLEALMKLHLQGARKLIVDLRGNAGGYMEQAIMMANEFLPKGRTIVYTKGRTPVNDVYATSTGEGSFRDMELAVLTDEFSASASEIFAGAIQDNDRGLVIGRRTFGKGLVQNQFSLPDESAIRLTVARYYTPSGRSIQKEYSRGAGGKYDMDLIERYNHGEFYSADSIKLDKTKTYKTVGGRTVYGGGGIMPDIFIPEDTVGMTSYYISVINKGLVPRYSLQIADNYRKALGATPDLNKMLAVIPRDNTLLNNFVDYAETEGVPARWYYINRSSDLLLRQLKAFLARDLIGFEAYLRILNQNDPVVNRALQELNAGNSPINIKK